MEGRRTPIGRILRAGLLAGGIAAVVNVVLAMIAARLLSAPPTFAPLQAFTVATSTVGGALLATAVYALLNRFARRPARLFRVIAPVALALSWVFPIYIQTSDSPRFAGATPQIVAALIILHTVVAILCVALLTSTARE